MARQTLIWTAIPFGHIEDGPHAGRYRVSVVVAPRLFPETASETNLGAFPEFLDWPATLAGIGMKLKIGADPVDLVPVTAAESDLWGKLFDSTTPVAGFQFQDMSTVNLRSYSVRNVLGTLSDHYGKLAVQAAAVHPTLLPWNQAHPDLKNMLTDLGTRTQTITLGRTTIEVPLPGFSRFLDPDGRSQIEERIDRVVFSDENQIQRPFDQDESAIDALHSDAAGFNLRTLPADWQDPAHGGPYAAVMGQFNGAGEYALFQASRFYRRRPPTAAERAMRRPSYADVDPAPEAPTFDFHAIVASLNEFPALLRRLGLIIDCAVADNGVIETLVADGGGQATGHMSVVPDWADASHDPATDVSPRCAWQADRDRFLIRPRGADLQRGLLRLEGASDRNWRRTADRPRGPFDVSQVDADGAALKTIGFTLSAQNLVAKSLSRNQSDGEITYTTGDKQALAALRSAGIGLSRHDRATRVAADAAIAAVKNQAIENGQAGQVVLYAEEMLLGYRVDVAPVPDADQPGPWHRLCAREGLYRLIRSGETLDLPPDEGYAASASTASAMDEEDPEDHYLHESVFRWTGWSLCVPLPGRVLRAEPVEDSQLQAEVPVEEITDQSETGHGVAATFRPVKGSLPKLRFGQLYRLRARLVDLAGNSLAVDDSSLGELENATEAVGYWRFEPVDPPVLAHRHRVSEGESLERMVIRSNFDADPETYLASIDFAAAIGLPESGDFEYRAENERHVVPPKSSQQQCEQHGLFDTFFSDPDQIKAGYAIAARESATLYETTSGSQIEWITPARLDGVATTADIPPELPGPDNPVGDRTVGGQYVIHKEALIQAPYLPDGAAGGLALRAAPGHTLPGVDEEMDLGPDCLVRRAPNQALVLLVRFTGEWPNRQGLRIRLAERWAAIDELPCAEHFPDEGLPKWDPDARVLTLFVAKGRIVRLLYSSYVNPEAVRAFGIPHWAQTESQRQFITGMAEMGCHWMLAPYRSLTLVHVTQQPVCLPELIRLSVQRQPGAHDALLVCRTVRLHGPSTGKFEIEAAWEEWVDDLNNASPERREFRGQLGEIQLPENHPNEFILSQAVAAQQVAPQRVRARGDRHEFGDTRFRLVRYRARATSRFREYLPAAIHEDPQLVSRLGPVAVGPDTVSETVDDPGAPVLIDPAGSDQQHIVSASEAPDDPRVLYVVPTFRWQESESGGTLTRTRHGNGLRVWLDRPWFSSGDGELLGVMLFRDGARFTDVPADMQALVTQWGLDPVWGTQLPNSQSRVSDFPARVASEAVRLQERPDRELAQVVGHRVHWDEARRLWYCDLEVNTGASYIPFVRLALVRYQPHALPAAKVSKVVLAEFAQVLPLRRVLFTRDGARVNLKLRGPVPAFGPMKFSTDSLHIRISPALGPLETGRNRVELVLQKRAPDMDSDLGWEESEVLASAVIGPPGSNAPAFIPLRAREGIFAETAAVAAPGRTLETRGGGPVRLAAELELGRLGTAIPDLGLELQVSAAPRIWEVDVDLPVSNDKPARLMLREFERYYTDRTVPETVFGTSRQRRVVEERLVYATIFDID